MLMVDVQNDFLKDAMAERPEVLALPERAMHFRDGTAFVKVEPPAGTVEERPVAVGLSDGLTTEIVSGLTDENQVYDE